jgi:hypothetical protein
VPLCSPDGLLTRSVARFVRNCTYSSACIISTKAALVNSVTMTGNDCGIFEVADKEAGEPSRFTSRPLVWVLLPNPSRQSPEREIEKCRSDCTIHSAHATQIITANRPMAKSARRRRCQLRLITLCQFLFRESSSASVPRCSQK